MQVRLCASIAIGLLCCDQNMLSRCAQGLYWANRYLERAEHLCRLMEFQVSVLVDRPVEEIYFGWRRIYESFGCQPSVGDLEVRADEAFAMADSYTLADNITFELTNPNSLLSYIALGRENARQMRHCISAEMWSCLNLAYLRLKKTAIQDIWQRSPETFYSDIGRDIHTFSGVTEATMYRDEGWHFMRLGTCIERTQLVCALVLTQIDMGNFWEESPEAGWKGLLQALQSTDAYERCYGLAVSQQSVLDLLIANPLLPYSLCSSMQTIVHRIETLAQAAGHRSDSSSEAERIARQSYAMIRDSWTDGGSAEDAKPFLRKIQDNCRLLHDLIMAAYVGYAIEEAPVL